MILRSFCYQPCENAAAAVAQLAEHGDDAKLIAGGTVVVALMKHGLLQPGVLIGLEPTSGLGRIDADDEGGVHVGALATHRAIAAAPIVRERAPLLALASSRVASPTIRAMGTIGGNLCYAESASDPAPALLVSGASLSVLGPEGERTIDVADFYQGFYTTALGEAEVLLSVRVAPLPSGAAWTYHKWTPRAQEDKPLIGLAALLNPGADGPSVRLAVGGVAECPVLLRSAATVLTGSDLSDATIRRAADAAADEVEPIEDLQGSPEYRRDMLRVWVRRVITGLRDRHQGGAA